MKNYLLIILSYSVLLSCKHTEEHPVKADYYIKNVNIIDVVEGKTVTNKYITILDDKISGIYDADISNVEEGVTIDGTNKFLIPGLWDMHAHISFDHRYQMGMLLANGVTGTRELWGVMDSIDYIRKGAAQGDFLAPEIFTSGNIIDGKPAIFPGMTEVVTEEEAREAVREQAKQGVDFIKVYSNLKKKAYLAVADEAKKQGVHIAGHIPEAINTLKL